METAVKRARRFTVRGARGGKVHTNAKGPTPTLPRGEGDGVVPSLHVGAHGLMVSEAEPRGLGEPT